MFFAVSKIAWVFVAPSTDLVLLVILGLLLSFTRWLRVSRWVLGLAAVLLLFCGLGPAGNLVLRPLEDRFPRPAADLPAPYGILVLGGGMDESMLRNRDALVLTTGGSRMTDAVMLARRYPEARLFFTGGTGSLISEQKTSEADAARVFFRAMGIDEKRMGFEGKSRNTFENATFSADILHPTPDQNWLLVTSAYHVPRAVGLFRKAGFHVTAWPSDYLTSGTDADFLHLNETVSVGLGHLDIGIREWIGLVAYHASGKIADTFPGP